MLIQKLLNWFKSRSHRQTGSPDWMPFFFQSSGFVDPSIDTPDSPGNIIYVCVELLDEGTDTWRWTKALNIGNGFYKLLPTPDYDPEDEFWAFLPGDIVRLEQAHTNIGTIEKAVRHPNLDVIRIDVEQKKGSPLAIKSTNALGLGGGLYKILPTPTYDPRVESWKFLPGDIVRLKKIKTAAGFSYLEPFEKVENA